MDKQFFEFNEDKQIAEGRIFTTILLMQKSLCRNGNLSMSDIFDNLWNVVGDKNHPSRLYSSISYLANHGVIVSKKYRKIFNNFYLDHTNLPMVAESFYDMVWLINLKDFMQRQGFFSGKGLISQSVISNFEILQNKLLAGESICHRLLPSIEGKSHEDIDKVMIENFGVNFRSLDCNITNLWDDIKSSIDGVSGRQKFVRTYRENSVDVLDEDSDYDINLKATNYMLNNLVQATSFNKDKMSINSAIKYVKNNQFKDFESEMSIEEMYSKLNF